jgi:DNA-binding NtrC family response regulator
MKSPASLGTILFVDDDPDHLKIYGWIVEQAGFSSVPCLVSRNGIDLPTEQRVDLVVLDYTLNCDRPTPEIARSVLDTYPGVPIVLLSQLGGLPRDMEPFVTVFVRKGEPQKLTEAIRKLLLSHDETDRPK